MWHGVGDGTAGQGRVGLAWGFWMDDDDDDDDGISRWGG